MSELTEHSPYMNQRKHLRFVAGETGIPVETLQMSEDGKQIRIRDTGKVLATRKEDGYFSVIK